MSSPTPNTPDVKVTRVLPAQGKLSTAEADAVIEVAYLTTAADGKLTDTELDSFRDVVCVLRKLPKIADRDFFALLDAFGKNVEHKDVRDRLAELALVVSRPEARDVAYKLSFAMALADLATSDAEDEFDAELLEALKLTPDQAEDLEGQVFAALDGDENEGGSGEAPAN